MASQRLGRRISAAVGGGAVIAMICFTASCSTDSETPEESPTTTTTTTTTTPPPLSPTEKAPNPDGPGIFTPPVTAPQPTVNPGRDDYGN
ncbi:hypothetical protein FHR72_000560 [Mycolicibacterium iranicum]|uniref:Uncharacterized protein n=1 Tax=Mycolicibacterium iranicum TaxID=912594 RepID=A0A839Q0Z7_MYCIR|nr:hypothetical protein [Mycolicibacterium iranicum]MBB2989103.1 hypothetical protein [Mycolicibacterium iranicum]